MSPSTPAGPTACPCGSGASLQDCCGPILAGAPAATAVALMRSRYTAFVLADETHLLRSWHSSTRPAGVEFEPRQHWLGLSVKTTEAGGPDDTEGRVAFVARFRIDGRAQRLHEVSRFVREAGRWVYLDGEAGEPAGGPRRVRSRDRRLR